MTVHMRPYVKDGIELDQIAVKGIRVAGFHGVNPNEREGGQLFYADVVAHVNTRAAGQGDDLAKTINYSDLADRTADVLAGSPYQLIEAVAAHIARAILEFDGVQCVDVTVHKPQAPLHVEFKDVTVTIRRDLNDGTLWADKRIGSSAGFSDDPGAPEGFHAARDAMDVRPAQPVGALIAMGGNLGEVEPTFREALAELHRVSGVSVLAVSPLVRSAPEGGAAQPDYLNAVVRIETSLAPRELLAAINGIEMVHGRDRTVPGSARTLDLDIVSFDGVTGETEDLTLPHPRAHQRGFVILPWVAMERDAVLEPHGSIVEIARAAQFDGVSLASADWVQAPQAAPVADQVAEREDVVETADAGVAPAAAVAAAAVMASAPEEPSAPAEPSAPEQADPNAVVAPEQVPPESVVPAYETVPSVPTSYVPTEYVPASQPEAASEPEAPIEPTPADDVPTFSVPSAAASAPQAPSAPQEPSVSRPTFQPAPASEPQGFAPAPEPQGFASAAEQASAPRPVSPYETPVSPYETSAASSGPADASAFFARSAAAAEPTSEPTPAPVAPTPAPASPVWSANAPVPDVAPAAPASAPPQWAPVGDQASAASAPPATGTVPTRTSFGVMRQTPPPAPESNGADSSQ
ncbi:2-amino-4-hydroxy-6-hydroxymethyldihydropteridine diphosphokinase [Demequina sp.]|uniref:2-amino-4-hydroxy-6- hydroxymethyldihydropteridine diphosphokinase n=1 Tax=Demequina sp. TaxID=2050685 RepID=UPI003A878281